MLFVYSETKKAVATVGQMRAYMKAENPQAAQSVLETGYFGGFGLTVTLEFESIKRGVVNG